MIAPNRSYACSRETRRRRSRFHRAPGIKRSGAEFVMVGARDNPQQAYDIGLDTEHEDYDHAETIRALRMVKSRHPVRPLFEGHWA